MGPPLISGRPAVVSADPRLTGRVNMHASPDSIPRLPMTTLAEHMRGRSAPLARRSRRAADRTFTADTQRWPATGVGRLSPNAGSGVPCPPSQHPDSAPYPRRARHASTTYATVLHMRHWVIQANPAKKWDIFRWWNETDEDLTSWLLGWEAPEFRNGDRFALWVGGKEAGIYAAGRATGSPEFRAEADADPYWRDPPQGPVWEVGLRTELYLFEDPIRKADLKDDPGFADALILRMPRYRNPIPLTPDQWTALSRHLPVGSARRRAAARPTPNADVIVTERHRGIVTEDITVFTAAQERTRTFREARLVADYERFLGYRLPVRSIRLPTGEFLVVDGYDEQRRSLIEAKATATRQDVRMGIGQLLDYRRHIDSQANLVLLLPERPSEDLMNLLRTVDVQVVARSGQRFKEF